MRDHRDFTGLRDLLLRLVTGADVAAAESFDHGHEKQGLYFRDAAKAARATIDAIEQEAPLEDIFEAMEMPTDLGEPLDLPFAKGEG